MSEDEILPTSTLARRLLAEEYNQRNGNMLSKGETLWWSAAGGRLELARLLIDEGADLDWVHPAPKIPVAHAAARRGQCVMLVLLHEAGADLTGVDDRGSQPLHWAMINLPQRRRPTASCPLRSPYRQPGTMGKDCSAYRSKS